MAFGNAGPGAFQRVIDNYQDPFVEYNPDHFVTYKGNRQEPLPGYVFPQGVNGPAVRGFYVPGSLRTQSGDQTFSLDQFHAESLKPIWYLEPGSTTPIKVISGYILPTVAYQTPIPAYYVPEHILLENSLPASINNRYTFVPAHCITKLPYSVARPKGDQLKITYAPASPALRPLPGQNEVNPNSITSRLEEEVRTRNIYEGHIGVPGRMPIGGALPDAMSGLSRAAMFAVEAFSTAASFLIMHRLITEYFY